MEQDLPKYSHDNEEVELYKRKLGATARLEVEPSTQMEARYMNSGEEPLSMDPFSAYMMLMSLLGKDAIMHSVFPENYDESDYVYYADGNHSDATFLADKESPIKLERLVDVAREVGSLNIQEEEFDPNVPDTGERMLMASEVKVREAARVFGVTPVEVGLVLDNCEKIVDVSQIVDVEVQQYALQIEESQDFGYCAYVPGVPTDREAEYKAELLDIVNLSYHLGFKFVKIPPYLESHQQILENNDLRVTILCDDDEREEDVLYWQGRHTIGYHHGDARYVPHFDLKEDVDYYPSLLYGRGFSIECHAITSAYVPGKSGLLMRHRVRDNVRHLRASRYKNCVFYLDTYRDFFRIPLGKVGGVILKDKRCRSKFAPSKKRLKSELAGLFSACNDDYLDDYSRLLDMGRVPRGHLVWVMLIGFDDYFSVFQTIYEVRDGQRLLGGAIYRSTG
jgi:hypothetical protein